jgi:hypothetical protein
MASATDVDNIDIKQYNVYYGGVDLGLTTNDSLTIELNGEYVTVDDAEQFAGVVAEIEIGIVPMVTMEFMRADFPFIRNKILSGRVEVDISGIRAAMHLGNKKRKLHQDLNEVLRLHPKGISNTDYSQDIYLHKTAVKMEATQLIGSRTAIQRLSVTFSVYPDMTKAEGREYGIFGDWTLTTATPIGVWIQAERFARVPGKQLTAMSLTPGQTDRVAGFAGYGDDTSDTLDIDFVAGYTATDTSLVFDALTTPSILTAGTILKYTTELIYIVSIAWTSTTAGTLTVVRGVLGSVAVALPDGTTITVKDFVSTENATDKGAWLSSDPTKATVGDTYDASDTTKKGVLAHVAAGSTNITITVNTVASPNLAITTT